MPRFADKKADTGYPVTIEKDRYVEGDVDAAMEGGVVLGEKPGNVTFPIQLDASGYLKINLVAGGYSQHEYQDGTVNTGAYGTLMLGDDGANMQSVMVDSSGRLQVEVVQGEYDGVQYQDGAAVASPFGYVAMGHDGSNVFPVITDASGYLQVDVRNLPADIFAAEGQALGKGVLIQGDDGTDRHNITVDASGNVQVDIVGALPIGNATIGKLAANSGIDIGDVGVISEPKADVLNSITDVTLAATSTTQILPALASRCCALIANKRSNTQTLRIGDASAGATRGIELPSGACITIETTEAIYGYNPGGAGQDVSAIWTED